MYAGQEATVITRHGTTDWFQIRKQGLPWYSASKESACSAGDPDWVQLLDWEDPLQKEMATHSSILVCKILGTDELCGL